MANERWILAPGQRVTFARFMELALYHPQLGYYARPRGAYPAGPEGDFVTAPTAHPLFAALWAEILAALRERRGQPLTFVDLGAGDGRFLRNLAGFLDAQTVARLMAVEVSPAGREAMAASLPQVELAASLAELSPSEGPCVIFASELYDALPCHLLEGTEGGLCELYVEASEDGTLRLVADNPSTPELSAYLAAVSGLRFVWKPGGFTSRFWPGREAMRWFSCWITATPPGLSTTLGPGGGEALPGTGSTVW
jgi:SAM-dependent MidA family methyltransferase